MVKGFVETQKRHKKGWGWLKATKIVGKLAVQTKKNTLHRSNYGVRLKYENVSNFISGSTLLAI